MKIRICITLALTVTYNIVAAQRSIPTTDTLTITGAIKSPIRFSLQQLDTFAKDSIPPQLIYNHRGEVKDTLSNLMGIPIKKVLESVHFDYEKPKQLNEFYFVFTASDGYRVVFSWNEIYNTELGNQFYIISQMGSYSIYTLPQRIAFISAADIQSGRRYIKGLSSIEVKRLP